MIVPTETTSTRLDAVNRSSASTPRIKPPRFAALPVRRATHSILLSGTLHTLAMALVIWAPGHLPIPVVLEQPAEEMKAHDGKPITFEPLPPVKSLKAKSETAPKATPKAANLKTSDAPPAPLKRDYAGPQEIISLVPHATNRVQTILRPDLAAPPPLKFPLRLQSVVMMKAATSPDLAKDAMRPKLQVPVPPRVEIPVVPRTVANPELTLMPVKAVPVQPEAARAERAEPSQIAPKPDSERGPTVVDMRGTAKKSAIVLNAVNVTPDPHVQIPDAQLAGSFVVGPPTKTALPALAPGSTTTIKNAGGSSATLTKGKEDNSPASPGHRAGGPESSPAITTETGGTGLARGPGSPAGSGKGHGSGITISTGAPGGNDAGLGIAVSGSGANSGGNIAPGHTAIKRTYGLTVTAAGGSGGASRDMGVFGRSEIVYSVAIPMADAGCPSDWPMQYALLNPRPRGASLLEPPVATKKVAAVAAGALAEQSTPIFVRGVIDEKGKLVGLQTILVQDPRGEVAIQALEKWEFLPAILDGTPVASKVLIGVVVTAGQ